MSLRKGRVFCDVRHIGMLLGLTIDISNFHLLQASPPFYDQPNNTHCPLLEGVDETLYRADHGTPLRDEMSTMCLGTSGASLSRLSLTHCPLTVGESTCQLPLRKMK